MDLDTTGVGRYRAIMTTQDRERITGKADVETNKEYQTISRIRSRVEELREDAEILREHHPELYDELQEAVCEDR